MLYVILNIRYKEATMGFFMRLTVLYLLKYNKNKPRIIAVLSLNPSFSDLITEES